MSFMDEKPRLATLEDTKASWNGAPDGKRFRCYLCGYKFKVGDTWRWVRGQGYFNFMTCWHCDGPDVHARWVAMNREAKERFWWFFDE